MSKLNAKEAPKGYRAVESPYNCLGCDFYRPSRKMTCQSKRKIKLCFVRFRKDGCNVIFKRIKKGASNE